METKYKKTAFDGYTHRFMVEFDVVDSVYNENIHIYTNNASNHDLIKFLEDKITSKVKSFNIVHKATKEQDELTTKFIEEILKDL